MSALAAQQRAFVFVVRPTASLVAAAAAAATGLVAPDGHRSLLYAAAVYLVVIAGLSALAARRLEPALVIRVGLLLDVAAVAAFAVELDTPYRVAAAAVWPIAASAVVLGLADTTAITLCSLLAVAVAVMVSGPVEPRLLIPMELGLAVLGLALSAAMRPARRAQAALAERSTQDAAALAISERIRASLELDAVLRTTVSELGRQLDAAACSLRLAGLDDAPGAAFEWEQPAQPGVREPAATLALATLEQEELVLIDGSEHPDVADERDPRQPQLTAVALPAALGYPLRWGERMIAALGLVSERPRDWRREAVPLLDRLAPQLTAALAQAEAYEQQQRTILALEEFDEQRQQLVAAVSHELRTPVTATLGFLETLLSRPELSEQDRRRFLHEAAAGARRLARLVDDLLVLTRTERRTLPLLHERVEPHRLLEQALSGLLVPADRTVSFRTDDNCTVTGDPDRLLQVLSNLLSNALVHGHGEITVSCTRLGGHVRIEVADEGPGIPKQEAEQLFVPFARFGANEGTGLGLAISRGLAEAHGGSLEYRPKGPQQHAFVLELPAAELLEQTQTATTVGADHGT